MRDGAPGEPRQLLQGAPHDDHLLRHHLPAPLTGAAARPALDPYPQAAALGGPSVLAALSDHGRRTKVGGKSGVSVEQKVIFLLFSVGKVQTPNTQERRK